MIDVTRLHKRSTNEARGWRGGRSAGAVAAVLLGCGLLGGCASLGVEPWEREVLARPEMAPEGVPLHAELDDHTYFSKEAATGGRGFGGGGCGCN